MALSARRVSRWAAIAEKPLKNSYSRLTPCTIRSLQVWLVCPEKRRPVVFKDINYSMWQLAGTRQHEWICFHSLDTWCFWVRHCFPILKLDFIILNWSVVKSRELFVPLASMSDCACWQSQCCSSSSKWQTSHGPLWGRSAPQHHLF